MFKKLLIVNFMLIVLWSNFTYAAETNIKYSIPVFPPYTFEQDGKIQGIGVALVEEIMKEAGIQYTFAMVPNYGKALLDIKQGNSDGFFLASQNAERDEVALFSDTILINKWCWFFPSDSTLDPASPDFKTNVKAGTYLNTNTEKWLKDNGYKVAGNPPNINLLLKMLKAERINAIFLAEDVFYMSVKELGGKSEDYKKVVQVEKPFGIYISKEYLSKNQGVMEKINAAIKKIVAK